MAHVNNKPVATPTIKGGNGNGEYVMARKYIHTTNHQHATHKVLVMGVVPDQNTCNRSKHQ